MEEPFTILPDGTAWEASGGACVPSPYWAGDAAGRQGSGKAGPGQVPAGRCSLGGEGTGAAACGL